MNAALPATSSLRCSASCTLVASVLAMAAGTHVVRMVLATPRQYATCSLSGAASRLIASRLAISFCAVASCWEESWGKAGSGGWGKGGG